MFSSIIFFSALLFSTATASPLEARSTCHPNFEGATLLVSTNVISPYYSTLSWVNNNAAASEPVITSPSPFPTKWYVQQNGDYDSTYTIKNFYNLNIAVELNGTQVIMDNIDWSGSNVNQKWKIECSACPTDISHQTGVVASGCIISSAAPSTSGLCIWMSGWNRHLDLTECPGNVNGNYYFSVSS
ncbi:hypothetical protein DFS33DRAFT_1377916 [Desarmillaria ectypa]|nr:hypothetical protein DFS33DRAFT_1377916 [Desarmillaria ectypa]